MTKICEGEPGSFPDAQFTKAPNGQWVHNVVPLHYLNGSLVDPGPIPGTYSIIMLSSSGTTLTAQDGDGVLPPGLEHILEQDDQAGVPNSRRWLLVHRLLQTAVQLPIPALEQLVAHSEDLASR